MTDRRQLQQPQMPWWPTQVDPKRPVMGLGAPYAETTPTRQASASGEGPGVGVAAALLLGAAAAWGIYRLAKRVSGPETPGAQALAGAASPIRIEPEPGLLAMQVATGAVATVPDSADRLLLAPTQVLEQQFIFDDAEHDLWRLAEGDLEALRREVSQIIATWDGGECRSAVLASKGSLAIRVFTWVRDAWRDDGSRAGADAPAARTLSFAWLAERLRAAIAGLGAKVRGPFAPTLRVLRRVTVPALSLTAAVAAFFAGDLGTAVQHASTVLVAFGALLKAAPSPKGTGGDAPAPT